MRLEEFLIQETTQSSVQLNNKMMQQALTQAWNFTNGDINFYDMADFVQDLLMDAFSHEMPYGVQKGRTGTPDEWFNSQEPNLLMRHFKEFLEGVVERTRTIHSA